jgi:hypothetical protein
MNWTMKTHKIMEHSRGIYWLAHLMLDGVKVGTVEQMGRGGADEVHIMDKDVMRLWCDHCKRAGGEEEATYALLLHEEGVEAC